MSVTPFGLREGPMNLSVEDNNGKIVLLPAYLRRGLFDWEIIMTGDNGVSGKLRLKVREP